MSSVTLDAALVTKYSDDDHPRMSYGTAGFRDRADRLPHIMFRMGIMATLHSKKFNGKAVGIMITASHNPASDNGIKLISANGEMLDSTWEWMATDLANSLDSKLSEMVNAIAKTHSIDVTKTPHVIVGRDTRLSGLALASAVADGFRAVTGNDKGLFDFGMMTTPTLHFVVQQTNLSALHGHPISMYMNHYLSAFKTLRKLNHTKKERYQHKLHIDCANGVASYQLEDYVFPLADNNYLHLIMNNYDWQSLDILNDRCGADYVKVGQRFPDTLANMSKDLSMKFASFDGDADRILYYYFASTERPFVLLDGDRIATLVTVYLKRLLSEAGLDGQLSMGLVQTAYANGNSTRYIKDQMKIEVSCTKTGVKHLAAAAHSWDIGVYFEANGHGTVVFSDRAERLVSEAVTSRPDDVCCQRLSATLQLINQTVGDAFSDLLLVETALHYMDWSLVDWAENTYIDLPSRQLKVSVPNRLAIETTDAERRICRPVQLQTKIDALVKYYSPLGRAFVRPSGTEDVVRVYAEAESQADADKLAGDVATAVKSYLTTTKL